MFRKARWKTALACLSCVAFVFIGLWIFNMPVEDYTRRMPPEPITKALAVLLVLYFGWRGAVAFANTGEPSRLILTSAGFRVEGVSARPLVAWADVEEVFVEEVKLSRHVFYREASLYPGTGRCHHLPGQFEEGPDLVCSTMNRWLKVHRLPSMEPAAVRQASG